MIPFTITLKKNVFSDRNHNATRVQNSKILLIKENRWKTHCEVKTGGIGHRATAVCVIMIKRHDVIFICPLSVSIDYTEQTLPHCMASVTHHTSASNSA